MIFIYALISVWVVLSSVLGWEWWAYKRDPRHLITYISETYAVVRWLIAALFAGIGIAMTIGWLIHSSGVSPFS